MFILSWGCHMQSRIALNSQYSCLLLQAFSTILGLCDILANCIFPSNKIEKVFCVKIQIYKFSLLSDELVVLNAHSQMTVGQTQKLCPFWMGQTTMFSHNSLYSYCIAPHPFLQLNFLPGPTFVIPVGEIRDYYSYHHSWFVEGTYKR